MPTNITVVSTENDLSRLFRFYFEQYNYQVTIINPKGVKNIITAVQETRPSVIILRILPIESGLIVYDICKVLHQDASLKVVPIIIIAPDKYKALSAGAAIWSDIVFDIEKLRQKIEELIV